MADKRLTNSELHLIRLDEEEAQRAAEPGILELFETWKHEPDADAPLKRDPGK
jgi:hypothetical protein